MVRLAKRCRGKTDLSNMDRHNVKLALALAALMAPPLANGIDLIKEGAVFKYHKGTKEA